MSGEVRNQERLSGVLLHVTSLPSYGGVGDFGPAAYAFVDFLAEAKQRLWQVLPLSPTGYGCACSTERPARSSIRTLLKQILRTRRQAHR